jgi:hypothetical protein
MKTYQQQVHSGPTNYGASNVKQRSTSLQRAIDSSARMQAQLQRASLPAQRKVVQRWLGSSCFGKGEREPLLPQHIQQAEPEVPIWRRISRSIEKVINKYTAARETVVAHSPGITTGPVNVLNPVSQSLNFTNQYGTLSSTGNNANVGMGYTMSGASLVGDFVGGAVAVSNIYGATQDLLSENEDYAKRRQAWATVKSSGADLASQVVDVSSQGISIAANAGAAHLALAAPVVGGVVSGFVAGRAVRSAWRANKYEQGFKELADNESDLQETAVFAQKQMRNRKRRQLIGAAGAALGVGGTIALGVGVGIAAAATLATPIGWGLLGASAVVALGLGAHKAYRYLKKRRNGTLGADRKQHAEAIVDAMAYSQPVKPELEVSEGGSPRSWQLYFAKMREHDRRSASQEEAKKMLTARGIDPIKLQAANREDNIKLVSKKLGSWA